MEIFMKKILALVLALSISLQCTALPVQASDSGEEMTEEQSFESEDAVQTAAENPEQSLAETDGEMQTETEEDQTETAEPQTAGSGTAEGDSLGISAPSAVLMEASTGTVVLEKNAHEKLPPASVTKIMTLLLIFDALSQGKIRMEDTVTTSAYAASMGGSQVFLEEGETQSVETMIKCIAVASANDASVAMAEHIAGTESLFVDMMNERAEELGMNDTHFVNCCGLDTDGHLTTAYDIALMSRELIIKYPQIHTYSTIWMENITHTTKRGTEEFGLTNTNKLIRQYPYATGLKTGSTSQAKYCVSATAEKDGIELIAVHYGRAGFSEPEYRRDGTSELWICQMQSVSGSGGAAAGHCSGPGRRAGRGGRKIRRDVFVSEYHRGRSDCGGKEMVRCGGADGSCGRRAGNRETHIYTERTGDRQRRDSGRQRRGEGRVRLLSGAGLRVSAAVGFGRQRCGNCVQWRRTGGYKVKLI